jgi:hypothetical protein
MQIQTKHAKSKLRMEIPKEVNAEPPKIFKPVKVNW